MTPKLSERVDAATGPDRELDRDILIAMHPGSRAKGRDEAFIPEPSWEPGSYSRCAPVYTTSLDAALMLVPSEAFWRLGHDGDGADPSEFRAQVIVPALGGIDAHGIAIAATPALALCAAALKARSL